MILKILNIVRVFLIVSAIPVFLVTLNTRLVINSSSLYENGFEKYQIERVTGIEYDQLLLASKQIRDYFNDDTSSDLFVKVTKHGHMLDNLFNEREVAHMRDVKNLVRGVYFIQWISLSIILLGIISGCFIVRRDKFGSIVRSIGWGGKLTLSLTLVVGVMSFVGFQKLFLYFHLFSFSNDLWILDPTRDYLLMMFPESFFFDATIYIALGTVIESAILGVMPRILRIFWKV